MATLSQTLRGIPQADEQLVRGPGGVLQRGPTLKEATKKAGLAAAPTTPMGAEFLGVDKQVSKMAGTPQQMQASLQTALRTKQFGREATQQEAERMQKSAQLQSLGGLGDRVSEMISSEMSKLQEEEIEIDPQLAIIKENPTSQEAMDAMLTLVNSGQSLDDIMKLVPEAATTIATLGAESIREPESVKITEFLPQLGYDLPTLAGLLEVPEATLQDYTIEQVQDRVNELATQEFTQAQQLQQQAVSPVTGAAERQLAREAGRELSAVGIRATEADMQRLNESVARADQVTLLGITKPAGEWLANDEISALIKEIVESPEGSDLRKQVELEAPELYTFITNNEVALKDLSTGLDTSTTQFKKNQEKLIEARKSTGLSDEILNEINYDPEVPTGLTSYLSSLAEDDRTPVADKINSAVKNKLITSQELNSLTLKEIEALQIGQVDGNWDRFVKLKQEQSLFKMAGSPEEQLKYILTDGQTIDTINNALTSVEMIKKLGIPVSLNLGILDVDKDGKPDWDKLESIYNKLNPEINLKTAVNGIDRIKRSSIARPQVTREMLTTTPLTLDKLKLLEDYRESLPEVIISPAVTAMREGQEQTSNKVKDLVFAPAAKRTPNGAIDPKEYSNRFIQLSKEGNYINLPVLKQELTKWIVNSSNSYKAVKGTRAERANWYGNAWQIRKAIKDAGLLTPEAEAAFQQSGVPIY